MKTPSATPPMSSGLSHCPTSWMSASAVAPGVMTMMPSATATSGVTRAESKAATRWLAGQTGGSGDQTSDDEPPLRRLPRHSAVVHLRSPLAEHFVVPPYPAGVRPDPDPWGRYRTVIRVGSRPSSRPCSSPSCGTPSSASAGVKDPPITSSTDAPLLWPPGGRGVTMTARTARPLDP